jgi:alpha-L-fucosidase
MVKDGEKGWLTGDIVSMAESTHQWFRDARYGMFVHWGPYADWGRGEQILFREHLDQREYEQRACDWNPQHFDAAHWAKVAADGGFKYSTLTSRHHDGYCLWDSKLTDYTSVKQAPKRDFVGEWVDACRKEGLRVGLYYSLADWRVPAYWEGPEHDPAGWEQFCEYVHGQVRELLTDYGQIDVLWFDGPWPRTADEWRMADLVKMIRTLQPGTLINNRLDVATTFAGGDKEAAGVSESLGDFSTPEHEIVADPNRMWESCQVSTWRLWGFAR